MAISITNLSGGNTPADGSDPRTFPAIWNATATDLEGVATDLDTLEATVGAHDLNSLSGVGITTPVEGDLLTYNGTSWVNGVPAGSILQVVSTTKTDTFSMTAEDTWTDITGLSVVITPSSASSKVSLRVDLGHVDSSVLAGLVFRFVRDSTPIGIGTDAGSRIAGTFGLIADTPGRGVTASGSFVDSPSSTSAIAYKLQTYSQDTATTLINRRSADTDSTGFLRTVSTITAMEVAG